MRFVAIAAASLLALASGCGGDPTAATVDMVYRDGFETPLDQVRIEAGDGIVVRGYRSWLVIEPKGELAPRFEAEYRDIPCDEPLGFFDGLQLTHPPSSNPSLLSCRAYTNPKLGHENGRWLIQDHASGRWYYRVWKQ